MVTSWNFNISIFISGYTNINESLAETCHAMRKIIFRELNSCYESSEDETTSRNFFTILDSLSLIEVNKFSEGLAFEIDFFSEPSRNVERKSICAESIRLSLIKKGKI